MQINSTYNCKKRLKKSEGVGGPKPRKIRQNSLLGRLGTKDSVCKSQKYLQSGVSLDLDPITNLYTINAEFCQSITVDTTNPLPELKEVVGDIFCQLDCKTIACDHSYSLLPNPKNAGFFDVDSRITDKTDDCNKPNCKLSCIIQPENFCDISQTTAYKMQEAKIKSCAKNTSCDLLKK